MDKYTQKQKDRILEAKAEAQRFIKKCEAYEVDPDTIRNYSPNPSRAAVLRAALDCGHAMSQVNKSPYKE